MYPPALKSLRYPIGIYRQPAEVTLDSLTESVEAIEKLPGKLEEVVTGLSDKQLNTQYRPNGWTIRQVIHHLADSHMNGFIRFKLALTEESPRTKSFAEKDWAKLTDSLEAPVEPSLQLITSLHQRWVMLINDLTEEDLKRAFSPIERDKEVTLGEAITKYAWHGRHHLAHISSLIDRMNWEPGEKDFKHEIRHEQKETARAS